MRNTGIRETGKTKHRDRSIVDKRRHFEPLEKFFSFFQNWRRVDVIGSKRASYQTICK